MKNPIFFKPNYPTHIKAVKGGFWEYSEKSVLVFDKRNAYRGPYRGRVVGFRPFRTKEES